MDLTCKTEITKLFDQRHKWEKTGPYSCVCRSCGIKREIPESATLCRRVLDLPVKVSFCSSLPEKNEIIKDLPFIKVDSWT